MEAGEGGVGDIWEVPVERLEPRGNDQITVSAPDSAIVIKPVKATKYLGFWFDRELTWFSKHCSAMEIKAEKSQYSQTHLWLNVGNVAGGMRKIYPAAPVWGDGMV
jgi:hypothetical protein